MRRLLTNTIRCKANARAHQFRQMRNQVLQRILLGWTFFWTTQMAHQNHRSTIAQDLLDGWQCRPHARIVGDIIISVQRHVKINANQNFFAGKWEFFYSIHGLIFKLIWNYNNCFKRVLIFTSACNKLPKSAIFTRFCSIVSRYLTVTSWLAKLSWSTVIQKGVPMASIRR